MALVFYEKKTLLLRRIVSDEVQTDKELSKNHKTQSDEKVMSVDLSTEKLSYQAIQDIINLAND